MLARKFIIAGMTLEVVADAGDKWQLRNLTTNEMILMDKAVLEKSIKLGKAEALEPS